MVNWPKQRAWGWYATLIRTPWFCVKLLRFKPYGQLSMQKHQYRTEIWWFISGKGRAHISWFGDGTGLNYLGRKWKIPKNSWHQYTAFNKPVYVIELQYGRKVTESDIERKGQVTFECEKTYTPLGGHYVCLTNNGKADLMIPGTKDRRLGEVINIHQQKDKYFVEVK